MTKRLIVGLHGLPGSGKDTIGQYLATRYGFSTAAYADAIKGELAKHYLVSPMIFEQRRLKTEPLLQLSFQCCMYSDFVDWYFSTPAGRIELEELGNEAYKIARTPRWLMQTYGTDFRRKYDDLYWVKLLQKKVGDSSHSFVVTDVRGPTPLEVDALQFHGAVTEVFEVVRPNNPFHSDMNGHSSNQRINPWSLDGIICNCGDLAQLHRQVDRFIERMMEKSA